MYDVFVTTKCDFNLSDFLTEGPEYTTKHLFSIIVQLLEVLSRLFSFSIILLLQGIKHLKDRNVSHNDIKPRNLLLNVEVPDDSLENEGEDEVVKLKIGDLGMGGVTGGTPGWVAPEFIRGTLPGTTNKYEIH